MYLEPLPPGRFELPPAGFFKPVILSLPSVFSQIPVRADEALPLESVQNRIQHSIAPLQKTTGVFLDELDDFVTVALPSTEQDGKNQGTGRRGDQCGRSQDYGIQDWLLTDT